MREKLPVIILGIGVVLLAIGLVLIFHYQHDHHICSSGGANFGPGVCRHVGRRFYLGIGVSVIGAIGVVAGGTELYNRRR
jgi:hypothetical protein